MKKKKRITIKSRMADAIIEGGTFDLKDDGGGWKTVAELLANYMLRELSERDRFMYLTNGFLVKTKHNFESAIQEVEARGYTVYKHLPAGKRGLEFITVNRIHREADRCEMERIGRRVEGVVKHSVNRVQSKFPDKALGMRRKIKLLVAPIENKD